MHAWSSPRIDDIMLLLDGQQASGSVYRKCRFHHIIGYGAAYFSYSYAIALSAAIWQNCFPDGQMNRASGLLHDLRGREQL